MSSELTKRTTNRTKEDNIILNKHCINPRYIANTLDNEELTKMKILSNQWLLHNKVKRYTQKGEEI